MLYYEFLRDYNRVRIVDYYIENNMPYYVPTLLEMMEDIKEIEVCSPYNLFNTLPHLKIITLSSGSAHLTWYKTQWKIDWLLQDVKNINNNTRQLEEYLERGLIRIKL